jgi:hypothetical protein
MLGKSESVHVTFHCNTSRVRITIISAKIWNSGRYTDFSLWNEVYLDFSIHMKVFNNCRTF